MSLLLRIKLFNLKEFFGLLNKFHIHIRDLPAQLHCMLKHIIWLKICAYNNYSFLKL